MSNKLIIHIPHSSMDIPKKHLDTFTADSETILQNQIALTDYATDDLFNHLNHQNRLVFPVSRLLCDVERYENDEDEIMVNRGMGVVYTHGAYGEKLRLTNVNLRNEIVQLYYKPHHNQLLKAVQTMIDEEGYCIIVDAHSFPSKPLPYEFDQNPDRADFCIGTDDYHTPASLVKCITDYLREMKYSVELNKPYSGTMIPLELYNKGVPVISVMIEVNRRLYMDEATVTRSSGYDSTKRTINNLLDIISEWTPDEQVTFIHNEVVI